MHTPKTGKSSQIIPGSLQEEPIKERWIHPVGSKILAHELLPEEINIFGNYGYYKGRTKTKSSEPIYFKGKYVVIREKVAGQWKMYLDIWNRVAD